MKQIFRNTTFAFAFLGLAAVNSTTVHASSGGGGLAHPVVRAPASASLTVNIMNGLTSGARTPLQFMRDVADGLDYSRWVKLDSGGTAPFEPGGTEALAVANMFRNLLVYGEGSSSGFMWGGSDALAQKAVIDGINATAWIFMVNGLYSGKGSPQRMAESAYYTKALVEYPKTMAGLGSALDGTQTAAYTIHVDQVQQAYNQAYASWTTEWARNRPTGLIGRGLWS